MLVGALSGCFYLESINQRPSVQIRNESAEGTKRGERVRLTAVADDPEGDPIRFAWAARACLDATRSETCDDEPFQTSVSDHFEFDVINTRLEANAPTESVLVTLVGEDAYGAASTPTAQLVIPIIDITPTIQLHKTSRYNYVVGTPVELLARIGDDDDGAEAVSVTWIKDPPNGGMESDADLVDGAPAVSDDPASPLFLQYKKIFTPHTTGMWNVLVNASDRDTPPNTAQAVIEINVVADRAPCLAQLAPAVPPVGAALPLTQPTLFRVPAVTDDLDPYPLIGNDAIFGALRFEWQVRSPGTTTYRTVAGAIGNSLALDPASYAPGDTLDVRVQIYDRNETPIPCNASDATCSVISDNACVQRQTWRVEVR